MKKQKSKLVLSYSYFCNSTKYVDLYFDDYNLRYTVRKDKDNITFLYSTLLNHLPNGRLKVSNLSQEETFQMMLLYHFDFDIISRVQNYIDSTKFIDLIEHNLYSKLYNEDNYDVKLYDYTHKIPSFNKGNFFGSENT